MGKTHFILWTSVVLIFLFQIASGLAFEELSGWPRDIDDFAGGYNWVKTSPFAADLNQDGRNEVIYCSSYANDKTKIYVFNADGTNFPGWPVEAGEKFKHAHLAVGDLDKSKPGLEIVGGSERGAVYAFYADGTAIPGWPRRPDGQRRLTPVLADVDKDGDLEIIAGSAYSNGYLYVYNLDGTQVNGWPVQILDSISRFYSPAVADVNGDGFPEIFLGTASGKTYAFKHDGTLLAGWPVQADKAEIITVSIADLDKDGSPEIVCGGLSSGDLYVYCPDASLKPGWPVRAIGKGPFGRSNPILGDLNGDGFLEVVFAGNTEFFNSFASAFNFKGELLPGWPAIFAGGGATFDAAIADIDADGKEDLIVETIFGHIYAVSGKGKLLTGFPIDYLEWPNEAFDTTPLICDLGGDGLLDLVCATRGKLHAFCLAAAGDAQPASWPMFGQNPAKTRFCPHQRQPQAGYCQIMRPAAGSISFIGAQLEIYGSAGGRDFGYYLVKKSVGPDFKNWDDAGISLEANGTQARDYAKLATLDTSIIPDKGAYKLRLEVYDRYNQLIAQEETPAIGICYPRDIPSFNGKVIENITPLDPRKYLMPQLLACADYDNDGLTDIFAHFSGADTPATTRLFRNLGGNNFENAIYSSGIKPDSVELTGAFCDFNADGKTDLATFSRDPGPSELKLYLNDNGTFTDVSGIRYPWLKEGLFDGAASGLRFLDLDADNRQDFTFNGEYTRVFLQTPYQAFTVEPSAGSGYLQFKKSFVFDYDSDGDLDILCGSYDRLHLFENTGNAIFLSRPLYEIDGRDTLFSIYDYADIDNDGRFEFFGAAPSGSGPWQAACLKTTGKGSLTRCEHDTGIPYQQAGSLIDARFLDFNNDGWPDYYESYDWAANLGERSVPKCYFYLNLKGYFIDITAFLGASAWLDYAGQILPYDFDNDGDTDILLSSRSGAWHGVTILENSGNENKCLKIEPRYSRLNENGQLEYLSLVPGTRITAFYQDGRSYAQILGGAGGNLLPLRFGIDKQAALKSVAVTWPDGLSQAIDAEIICDNFLLLGRNLFLDNTNHLPQIDAENRYEITEGELLSFRIKTFDLDFDKIDLKAFGLPQGATLEYFSHDAGVVRQREFLFSWTPQPFKSAGKYKITLRADDGHGGVARKNIWIKVLPLKLRNPLNPAERLLCSLTRKDLMRRLGVGYSEIRLLGVAGVDDKKWAVELLGFPQIDFYEEAIPGPPHVVPLPPEPVPCYGLKNCLKIFFIHDQAYEYHAAMITSCDYSGNPKTGPKWRLYPEALAGNIISFRDRDPDLGLLRGPTHKLIDAQGNLIAWLKEGEGVYLNGFIDRGDTKVLSNKRVHPLNGVPCENYLEVFSASLLRDSAFSE